MRSILTTFACLCLLAGPPASATALAQGKSDQGKSDQGKSDQAPGQSGSAGKPGKAGGPGGADAGERLVELAITAAEAALIREWFGDHVPSDLDALPPGIRMKVARGGTLPPGIAKKQLPGGLLSRLPARAGQEWARVGRDVVLIERATGVVVDILKDAL
jgi:hypothetical protein